jgi:hypothetical protein
MLWVSPSDALRTEASRRRRGRIGIGLGTVPFGFGFVAARVPDSMPLRASPWHHVGAGGPPMALVMRA